jgi:hypothetical protein
MSVAIERGAGSPRRPGLVAYRSVRADLVEVVVAGEIVGYVELVGNVFVALKGCRYNIALEVAQSLSAEVAHRTLVEGGAPATP